MPDACEDHVLGHKAEAAVSSVFIDACCLQLPKRRRSERQKASYPIGCDCTASTPAAAAFTSDTTVAGTCGNKLYWFDEVPQVLRYNKYVGGGYRAGYSLRQCIQSILQYHNEIGNIWTHLLPALLLLSALLTGRLRAWPQAQLAFLENVVPILLCLLGSSTYHIFMANHWNYKSWLFVDVCGIFLLCLGAVNVVISWGLFCNPTIRRAYLVAYYGCAALCAYSGARAKSQLARGVPLLLPFLIRVSALGLRWGLGSGSSGATVHYAIMEAACILGGTINTLRIPEKWFGVPKPKSHGLFDTWLNSHQLMHLLVLTGMIHLHWGATLDYHHFQSHPGCSWPQDLAMNPLNP